MADNEVNKSNASPVGWGDPSSTFAASMHDEKNDFSRDGAGVPNPGEDNKYMVGGTFGDPDNTFGESMNDNKNDFAQDSAGLPSGDRQVKTDLDMALAPNKFPRETGHDSLGGEDATYLV